MPTLSFNNASISGTANVGDVPQDFVKDLNSHGFANLPPKLFSDLSPTGNTDEFDVRGTKFTVNSDIVKKGWLNLVVGSAGNERNEGAWDFWNNVSSSTLGNVKIYTMDNGGNLKKIDAASRSLDTVSGANEANYGFSSFATRSLTVGPGNRLFLVGDGTKVREIDTQDLSNVLEDSKDIGSKLSGIIYIPDGTLVAVEENSTKAYKLDLSLNKLAENTLNSNEGTQGLNVGNGKVYIGSKDNGLYELDYDLNLTSNPNNPFTANGSVRTPIFDKSGNIYVCTDENDSIVKLNSDLSVNGRYSDSWNSVSCMFGPNGNIYANHMFNDTYVISNDPNDASNPINNSGTYDLVALSHPPGHKIWGGGSKGGSYHESIYILNDDLTLDEELNIYTSGSPLYGAVVYDIE